MGINYRCSCGQQLVVEEQYAGMRMRCPACGAEAVVPSPNAAGAAVSATMPVHVAAAAKARTRAQIGLWCGILALVFFILFTVTCMVMGANMGSPRGGLTDSFRHGYERGASPAVSCLMMGLWGGSILLSILATIFGALGRKKINVHNRGAATTGMVLGIVSLCTNICCCLSVLAVMVAAMGGGRR